MTSARVAIPKLAAEHGWERASNLIASEDIATSFIRGDERLVVYWHLGGSIRSARRYVRGDLKNETYPGRNRRRDVERLIRLPAEVSA